MRLTTSGQLSAAQAAQKVDQIALERPLLLSAAQAAQKLAMKTQWIESALSAAQAAQKKSSRSSKRFKVSSISFLVTSTIPS